MPAISRQNAYLVIVTAAWSLLTILLVVIALTRFANQRRTESFTAIQVQIDSVQENATSNSAPTDNAASTDFYIDVRYHYFLNGERYDATRLRYGTAYGSHAWASAVIRQFPASTPATGYYNPANPTQSVLLRGSQSADYLPLLLMIPLTFIMLLLWVTLYHSLRFKTRFAGLDILKEPEVTRIRRSPRTAFAFGAAFIAAASFVGMLLILLSSGMHPSMRVATVIVLLAIVPGLLLTGFRLFQINAGKRDIVIDHQEKLVRAEAPRKITLPFHLLVSVHIAESEKIRIQGQAMLSVLLRHKVPDITPPQQEHLPIHSAIFDAQEADNLAIFLARELKIPAYSAANSRLVDPEAPVKPPPTTQAPVRPVFSNPYKPFKPTRRPPG